MLAGCRTRHCSVSNIICRSADIVVRAGPHQRYRYTVDAGLARILCSVKVAVFPHEITDFAYVELVIFHFTLRYCRTRIVFIRAVGAKAAGRAQAEARKHHAVVECSRGRYGKCVKRVIHTAVRHTAAVGKHQCLSGIQRAVAVPVYPALKYGIAPRHVHRRYGYARIVARYQRRDKRDAVFVIRAARVIRIIARGGSIAGSVALTVHTSTQFQARDNHVDRTAFRHARIERIPVAAFRQVAVV